MRFFIPGNQYPKDVVGKRKETAEAWSEKVVEVTYDLPKVVGPCYVKVEFCILYDRFTIGSPYGPDLDNLAKRLLDSLNETIFSDVQSKDGSVMKLTATKRYVLEGEEAGALIQVHTLRTASDDQRFLYFAYGSNMHRGRLENRVGGVHKVSNALLPKYVLKSNKKSDDGSAKANLEVSNEGSDKVWGVLWSVDENRRHDLNDSEGFYPDRHDSHYKPQEVIVFDEYGMPHKAITYIACKGKVLPEEGAMYSWYHDYLRIGARGNHLPKDHQLLISHLKKMDDPNTERNRKERVTVDSWPPSDACASSSK